MQIDRSLYSITDSFRYISTAIINLFFGKLIVKFGPKKLILAGIISLVIAMLLYSFAVNVIMLYLGGIFLGIGFSWTTTTMVGYVVNVWCSKNKGTIMGLVLASNGLGGALAMQIVSPIIESSEVGFKMAYGIIAIILAILFILFVIFFKDKPKEIDGSSTSTTKTKKASKSDWVGIEWKDITKKWWFYLVLVCVFFTGFVLQGITGISAAHMKDVGIDPAFVAMVLSVHSITLAFSKFLTGFMYDKFGLRITTTFCSVIAVITMFVLSFVANSTFGMILAMSYGVLSSVALPLETIILPIYASDLFGQKDYSKVLGIIVSVNVAGYALGAPAVNLIFDLFNSYNIALYICAGIMVFVIVGLQFVLTAAKKEKEKIILQEESLQN